MGIDKQPLCKTETAQFGLSTEEATTDVDQSKLQDKSNSINSLDKSTKKAKKIVFRRDVEVVYVRSYKEFNIQMINEKSDQLCGSLSECLVF
jgi:hypothetical protein